MGQSRGNFSQLNRGGILTGRWRRRHRTGLAEQGGSQVSGTDGLGLGERNGLDNWSNRGVSHDRLHDFLYRRKRGRGRGFQPGEWSRRSRLRGGFRRGRGNDFRSSVRGSFRSGRIREGRGFRRRRFADSF